MSILSGVAKLPSLKDKHRQLSNEEIQAQIKALEENTKKVRPKLGKVETKKKTEKKKK